MNRTFLAATLLVIGCGSSIDGGSDAQGGAAGVGEGAVGAGADSGLGEGAVGAGGTASGGSGGAGSTPASNCGPNVSDEACRSLTTCGRPAGAPSGERSYYAYFDLLTYTDQQMLERCQHYCMTAGRCGATDATACEAACTEVVQQARDQACEVSLLDAFECIEEEVCRHGFPTPTSGIYDHPCVFRTRLVDCTIVPERAAEAFAHFGAGEGAGHLAGMGGGYDGESCRLNMGDGMDWYEVFVQCDPSSQGLCCTCNAGGRPVREVATSRQCSSQSTGREFHEACGWRF